MAGAKDHSTLMKRILFGVAGVVLGGSMLLYLVPQGPATGEVSTDTVAKVGDESVTVNDIRQQLNQIERNNQVPRQHAVVPGSARACDRRSLYSMHDIRQQLNQIERNNQVPRQLESFYAQQILQNLVFQRELEYEAKRLGITVSDRSEEHTSELQSRLHLVCRLLLEKKKSY